MRIERGEEATAYNKCLCHLGTRFLMSIGYPWLEEEVTFLRSSETVVWSDLAVCLPVKFASFDA